MKKWIIIAFIVVATLVVAQRRSSSLHRIPSPTKIDGWLNVNGDVWPVIPGKWDLGKPANWWDSSFVSYPEFRNILVWSADTTDSASMSPTKLVIDSVISLYFSTPVSIIDTTYTNWLAVKDSSNITVVNPVVFDSTITFNDASMWMLGDTLFFTDGTIASPGADTSWIVNTGTFFEFGGDILALFAVDLVAQADFIGSADSKQIKWDGEILHMDFDADDDTVFFKAHDTGELRYIVASDQWEFINDIVLLGDSLAYITGACSTYWYQTADSSIIESNKPMRLGSGSIILKGDSVWMTDLHYSDGGGVDYGDMYVQGNALATGIAVQNTWYQVTIFGNDGESNNTTPDHTNDHITILQAGRYMVSVSSCFSGGANKTYEMQVKKNNGGTSFVNAYITRKLGAGGDIGSISLSGIIDLDANDTVELWIRCTDGVTADATVCNANLALVQIGGD